MQNFGDSDLKHFGKKSLPVLPIALILLLVGIIFISMQDITPETKPVVKIIEHEALK